VLVCGQIRCACAALCSLLLPQTVSCAQCTMHNAHCTLHAGQWNSPQTETGMQIGRKSFCLLGWAAAFRGRAPAARTLVQVASGGAQLTWRQGDSQRQQANKQPVAGDTLAKTSPKRGTTTSARPPEELLSPLGHSSSSRASPTLWPLEHTQSATNEELKPLAPGMC